MPRGSGCNAPPFFSPFSKIGQTSTVFMTGIIRLPIRNTKMGGSTRNIVLVQDPQGWKVLKPTTVVLSKSGHHGEEIYHIVGNYIIITLDISNSGKRSYKITGEESAKIKIIPLLEQWKNGGKLKISEIISALQ